MKIEIISATRRTREDFWAKSALGASLRRLSSDADLFMRIAMSNSRGLAQVYNEGLAAADPRSVVVFVHDDVWIDDYFLHQRIGEALDRYDIIGVAGNRRRAPAQAGWAFLDAKCTRDEAANLSGAVAHGEFPFGAITYFGATPADCELLDGVFLAAKKSVLSAAGVNFDARFDFHFYDMDFCRTARLRELRLGTWPICMTHQSRGGGFGNAAWTKGYCSYLEKWGS